MKLKIGEIIQIRTTQDSLASLGVMGIKKEIAGKIIGCEFPKMDFVKNDFFRITEIREMSDERKSEESQPAMA